jgi:plastin-1
LDSTGRLPKSTILTSLTSASSTSAPSGQYTYDQVRETLKSVSIDASGAVELDDFVDLIAKLKEGVGKNAGTVLRGGALSGLVGGAVAQPSTTSAPNTPGGGKVLVKGSNANVSHTVNEDERTEFTRHINQVCLFRCLLLHVVS